MPQAAAMTRGGNQIQLARDRGWVGQEVVGPATFLSTA
jgi:hypothetical protein